MKTKLLRTPEDKQVLLQQDLGKDFKLFSKKYIHERSYIIAIKEQLIFGTKKETIVGIVSIVEASSRIDNSIGIGFVNTHAKFRNCGIAKELVERLFQFANEEKKHISNTAYEAEGDKWLKPLMQNASEKYPDVFLFECGNTSKYVKIEDAPKKFKLKH
jgi:predicted subunit of tRNA(5-methylaminomethyl-2-thiouridylate) methyltransferase